MGTWYTTRETVKSALDSDSNTLSDDAQVDRAIEAASRSVEKLCHRVFYPVSDTRYFNWPNYQHARPWVLWLDQDEVVSVNTLVAGGVTIPSGNYFLESVNRGAPYRRIEMNVGTSSTFAPGPQTWQRAIAITGVFGYPEALSSAALTLDGAIGSTDTTIQLASALVGVGDTLKLGTEYVQILDRDWADTGLTLSADVASLKNTQTISLSAPAQKGEVLLVDAEQMFVYAVSGNNASVLRGYNGTTLTAHTSSTAVYGLSSLTVARGVNGSTAAAHSDASPVYRLEWPGVIETLTVAYAIDQLEQERSAYSRTVGSGDNLRNATGGAISRLEKRVYNNYARKRYGRAV